MRYLPLVVSAVVFAGCTNNPILLDRKVDNGAFLATDSKLRVITTSDQGLFSTAGLVEPQRITCTEPSPDVATNLVNSLGGGLSLFGKGSLSLSTEQVEGLVQLGERTAAIQLLRDKLYQTCLAYSNGAISGTTYSLIMSRLDDAIVTLSLGDGAAGAFGRKLAALGAEASSSADAAVTGLPAQVAALDDQTAKLAAANKKVDDAAAALAAHKATQPADGKQEEYDTQTKTLEKELTNAKAERDALLQLIRATASTATKVKGKSSIAQAGAVLNSNADAQVLRDMQGDFLVADSSRDLIFACMVELGLRGDGTNDTDLKNMTNELRELFKKEAAKDDPDQVQNRVDYAGAVLRARRSALANFCTTNLRSLIDTAAKSADDYRKLRAQLSAEVATARYSGDSAKAEARGRELFIESLKTCNTEFKDDAARRNACLDKIIPLQSDNAAKVEKPKQKAPAKSAGK